MKNAMKYMAGAAVGAGMYAMYSKYSKDMMKGLKKTVDKMSTEASKSMDSAA